MTIQFNIPVSDFGVADLMLSRNGGENLLTGSEQLSSSDNRTFVLSGLTNTTSVAGYYTLTVSGPGDLESGGPLDSQVSTSWAMGRSELGLTVNTLVDEADGRIDDGDVSLRDAIAAAAPDESINFDAALSGGTILLAQGELLITRPLSIDATELANGLIIDAAGSDLTETNHGLGRPILKVDDGKLFVDSPVTIRGLTLTGAEGPAIDSQETLSIQSVSISGNAGGGH